MKQVMKYIIRTVMRIVKKILLYTNNLKKLELITQHLTLLNDVVNDKIRKLIANKAEIPDIFSFDLKSKLGICVLEDYVPWSSAVIEDVDISGMISEEECRYYCYIGKFYSGKGEVVELGPWLGRSTFYIL